MDKDLERLHQSLVKNQQKNYTGVNGDRLKKLVTDGQKPPFFFIACSDSRYGPDLLPGIEKGDAFIVKNVAALVPPYNSPEAISVAAAVDFAVESLKVRHIIVKGHTHCGGVQGLVGGGTPGAVSKWLDTAKDVLKSLPDEKDRKTLCDHAEKNTIRWSLENLSKYPSVEKALKAGTLQIHGWRYDIETGAVLSWDEKADKFVHFFDPKSDTGPKTKNGAKPPHR